MRKLHWMELNRQRKTSFKSVAVGERDWTQAYWNKKWGSSWALEWASENVLEDIWGRGRDRALANVKVSMSTGGYLCLLISAYES